MSYEESSWALINFAWTMEKLGFGEMFFEWGEEHDVYVERFGSLKVA